MEGHAGPDRDVLPLWDDVQLNCLSCLRNQDGKHHQASSSDLFPQLDFFQLQINNNKASRNLSSIHSAKPIRLR